MLTKLLSPFIPGSSFKRKSGGKCRGGRGTAKKKLQCSATGFDVEAPVPRRRNVRTEAAHGMQEYDAVQDTAADTSRSGANRRDERALIVATGEEDTGLRHLDHELDREANDIRKKQAIANLIRCDSSYQFFLELEKVDDEWLSGFEALPGNIYYVLSFSLYLSSQEVMQRKEHIHTGASENFDSNSRRLQNIKDLVENQTRRLGFWCVMAIQVLGPPLIAYQYVTGHSLPWKYDWEIFVQQFPSLSDWSEEKDWSGTKLLATIMLFCFCLNILFCWMDEAKGFEKIFRIYKLLSNKEMRGSSEAMLRFSAFINAWVVMWLCIDLFMIFGSVNCAQEVLFDALGLSFLYCLDDIDGDLGFVDDDDWPGLQLAWFESDFDRLNVAADFGDIDDFKAEDSCMHIFTTFVTVLLCFITLALPVLYIFTPFKEMQAAAAD